MGDPMTATEGGAGLGSAEGSVGWARASVRGENSIIMPTKMWRGFLSLAWVSDRSMIGG